MGESPERREYWVVSDLERSHLEQQWARELKIELLCDRQATVTLCGHSAAASLLSLASATLTTVSSQWRPPSPVNGSLGNTFFYPSLSQTWDSKLAPEARHR